MKNRATIVILLMLLPLASASAAVTNLKVELTDPGAGVPGTTSNDLRIDFSGNLGVQKLLLELSAGSIYNDTLSNDPGPPNAKLFQFAPSLRFDSFVTLGGLISEESYPIVTARGTLEPACPAVVGGCDTSSSNRIHLDWRAIPGVEVPSSANFVIARITLSDDAAGTVKYLGATTADGPLPFHTTGIIQNGVISFAIPEPTTLVLLAFSICLWTANARRPRCSRNLPG
jgi:hypothetical protein